MSPIAVALIAFFVLLFLGLPISFTLGLSAVIYCVYTGNMGFLFMMAEKEFRGMDNFVLLAIPLFMLCGEIMNRGGISETIVGFADLLVGRLRGGLAYVNVLDSTFFAGITGSALSDISSLGSIVIPAMEKQGYDKDFSCALTAATAIQGPLIPPSIPAVLIASATGLSTGALFMGGAVPGLLIGAASAVVIFLMSRKRSFPKRDTKIPFKQAINIVLHSFFPLLTIVIVIGGMTAGFFTPTEAAIVAVTYAFIVTNIMFKRISWSEMKDILLTTLKQSATVYLIIAGATAFSWVLAMENIPNQISSAISAFAHSKVTVLLILNGLLLLWGMFMDTTPSILVLVPMLFPIIKTAGINPIHFGVIVVVNLMLGLLTPPFGMALFTVQAVGKCKLGGLLKAIAPFMLVDLVILLLITVFPELCLWLPRLFGFLG